MAICVILYTLEGVFRNDVSLIARKIRHKGGREFSLIIDRTHTQQAQKRSPVGRECSVYNCPNQGRKKKTSTNRKMGKQKVTDCPVFST